MKIKMKHIFISGFLSLILSACAIGLTPDVIPPPPPQGLVAPTGASFQPKLQVAGTYCLEPGFAWSGFTADECTPAPGTTPVTDVVYEVIGLPDGFLFDPDSRAFSLAVGRTTVPDYSAAIDITYRCYSAADPTVFAEVTVDIADCDGGGMIDGDEDANSAVPALTRDGYVSLTLRNWKEYLPSNRIRSNLVYPAGTGMDVFNPLDDSPAVSAASDIDGDGIANIADPNVFIAVSDASLTGSTISNAQFTYSIAAGDLNNDGLPDLIVANDDGLGINSNIDTYLNNGAGGFVLAVHNVFAGVMEPISDMTVGDFDNTQALGVAFTVPLDNRFVVTGGDGGGFLKLNQWVPLPGLNPNLIVSADYNGDNFVDVGVVEGNNLHIYLNNGFGTVVPAVPVNTYATCNAPQHMVTADIDADGFMDIAVTCNPAERVWTFFGAGNGQFGAIGSYGTGGEPMGLTVADFNNDGNLDFGIGSTSAGEDLQVILCNGNRTCQAVRTFDVNAIRSVVAADMNGDGFADMAGVGGPGLRVFINDGTGLGYAETTYDLGGPNGFNITAADFDGNNMIDLALTNNNPPGFQNVNIFLNIFP